MATATKEGSTGPDVPGLLRWGVWAIRELGVGTIIALAALWVFYEIGVKQFSAHMTDTQTLTTVISELKRSNDQQLVEAQRSRRLQTLTCYKDARTAADRQACQEASEATLNAPRTAQDRGQ